METETMRIRKATMINFVITGYPFNSCPAYFSILPVKGDFVIGVTHLLAGALQVNLNDG